jgi:hypothetical protein
MNRKEIKDLLHSLEAMKQQVKPDQDWKQSNREFLLSEIKTDVAERSIGWKENTKLLIKQFLPTDAIRLLRGPAIAVFGIIFIAMGGSIASVSASDRSLPGDLLYPIKLAAEQTRLVFTTNKTDKLRLKTEFVERRVEEIKTVAASDDLNKPEKVKAAAENIKRDLNTVKTQLQEVRQVSAKEGLEAAKLVDQKSAEIAQDLKEVKESSPSGDVKKTLSEAQSAAANTGVVAVEVMIDTKNMQNSEVENQVSDAELTQSIKDSIQKKITELESVIAEMSEKLTQSAMQEEMIAASATDTSTSSSTADVAATSTNDGTIPAVDPAQSIASATEALNQAKALLEEGKLDQAKDKLVEASKAAAAAAEVLAASAESESADPATEPTPEPATSTESGTTGTQSTTTGDGTSATGTHSSNNEPTS